MSRTAIVQTPELAGLALAWAVNMIEGDQPRADHLVSKYGIWCERANGPHWLADMTGNPFNRQAGESRTIAVYRALVFAMHGPAIEVPAEFT
ncbi:hypothetical protein [Pseudomonas sp. B26(2017)]|uniref:hypothetical protein n=1 Tax=Pseudomonas sp. B26(2017) TaxID=1981732 RepID=UPI000A1F385E|nr:hypothetical protein [Pseudomonas sp. B26(2017)]